MKVKRKEFQCEAIKADVTQGRDLIHWGRARGWRVTYIESLDEQYFTLSRFSEPDHVVQNGQYVVSTEEGIEVLRPDRFEAAWEVQSEDQA